MEAVECGAASLAIVLAYYGKLVPLEELRVECGVSRDGSAAFNVIKAAEKYGLKGSGYRYSSNELKEVELPAVLFWNFNHFLVLEGFGKKKVYLNDPGIGPRTVSYEEFEAAYTGVVLTFEKMESFVKGGRPSSLIRMTFGRLKRTPSPMVFLLLTGICLLVPGFAIPSFLMVFLTAIFEVNLLPWGGHYLLTAIPVTAFLAGAITWLQSYILNRLNSKLAILFSSDFLWHILSLPIRFFLQRYIGDIAYRMTLNESVAATLTGPITATAINLILVIFYSAVMFYFDAVIASIALFFGLLNLWAMWFVFRSRSNTYACLQQNLAQSIGQSVSGLQHMETIKAKGIELDFFAKWAGYYTPMINAGQSIGQLDVLLSNMPVLFQSLAVAVLLGAGCMRILNGELSLGTLMAMQMLLMNFLTPITRFIGFGALLQTMKIDIKRLDDVMNNQPDALYAIRSDTLQRGEPAKLNGELEFRNVTFRYSPLAEPTIKDLSFHLKPGKRIAFVGAVGSGKSTITRLACGLYAPNEGAILYDGLPLTKISRERFRNSLGTVDQDIFLFAGSVRENLTFWNQNIHDEMLLSATRDASIHEEIMLRPGGYEFQLVERGKNLSMGQQQQLEIARAFLYHPSILILDEATSALDSKTEKFISDKVRQRGCTTLMIAHRLSTIQDCDEILVLDRGIVVQRGTHTQLKAVPGIYQELVKGAQ
jgi:NHLM bacteriocin system ABC transporter peptidase/ATP-binding protein